VKETNTHKAQRQVNLRVEHLSNNGDDKNNNNNKNQSYQVEVIITVTKSSYHLEVRK
jgi:hypothetical protein